ncbi:MAG: type I methionyl aminopeptidase [Anaerolineae bacterium]
MAIELKSPQQIAAMREAGRLVAEIYEVLRPHVVPGVTTLDLDRMAEEYTLKRGATPVYKGYVPHGARDIPPFPATICASVNEVICHGIPSAKQVLKEGDIIGVDIGVLYKGWCGDSCVTYTVGKVDERTQKLVDVTKRALELAIEMARDGGRLGDIGFAIQRHVEANGFSVVREYTGHGVGRTLHEAPTVLHFGQRNTGMKLRTGMVFTIEPMVNLGRSETRLMADRWGVRTADGSLSAQFEHTLAITPSGPEILTTL